jgi:hypothetical protein
VITIANDYAAKTLWPSLWETRESAVRNDDASSINDTSIYNVPIDLFLSVHKSKYPAMQAGRWVHRPEEALHPSPKHLKCLDKELQGNCHDEKANLLSKLQPRQSRVENMKKGAVVNSPGILAANDPWVWESDIEEYKVMSYELLHHPDTGNVLFANNRTIYLLGDSLTRQWTQSLVCDAQHLFGMTERKAMQSIQFLKTSKSFPSTEELNAFLDTSKAQDYFIFNLGHHIGPYKIEKGWDKVYREVMTNAFLTSSFGKIPPNHVFFRTTSVRHFLFGRGDWNTNVSASGGDSVNMTAQWSDYGGMKPVQPKQNLLALQLYKNLSSKTKIKVGGILDTSPMTLARSDASFDGSHFCLPGPIDYWSRMLYHKIYTEEIQKQ